MTRTTLSIQRSSRPARSSFPRNLFSSFIFVVEGNQDLGPSSLCYFLVIISVIVHDL